MPLTPLLEMEMFRIPNQLPERYASASNRFVLEKEYPMSDWQAILSQSKSLSELDLPPICARCLTRDDLTSYQTGSKQEAMKVPICRSCKRELKRKARLTGLLAFAVWGPICFGILAFLIAKDIMGGLMERLGFPWGLFPPLLLIGTPLYCIYLILFPSKSTNWPMRVKETTGGGQIFNHTLAFENEPYVRAFAADNLPLIWDLTDWGETPPKKLVHPGQGVVDEALKQEQMRKNESDEMIT
jgi:hypothetical protein